MYDYLDDRQTKRLKELVPYEILAPDADEIIKELERLNNIINELESYLEQQWLEWKDDCDEGIVAMANEDKTVLDKLKTLKENK